MKKVLFLIMSLSIVACASRPKGFTYYFENEYTGLDTLINIDGYYVTKDCNSLYYSLFMFYPNGLCRYVETEEQYIETCLISFKPEGKEFHHFLPWGTYRVSNDTIYAQYVKDMGRFHDKYTFYTNYKILPDKRVMLISYSNGSKLESKNECNDIARFNPLEKNVIGKNVRG